MGDWFWLVLVVLLMVAVFVLLAATPSSGKDEED